MKNFIMNELSCAHKILNEKKDKNIDMTIEELDSIKKDIFKAKDSSCESKLFCNLSNTRLNDSIYDFMLYLLDIYSKIPHLETETSINYPVIRKQYISNKYIYDFSNRVLMKENFSKPFKFSTNNLLIFDNNKIFNKPDSRCIVYKRYYTNTSMILLNRYNNIRDLILPLKKFIEIIEYNSNIVFSNNTELIEYYMQHRAIKSLIDSGNRDAIKLYILTIDNMVYSARLLKKYTDKSDWKHLQPKIIFKLLDFTNHAIAIELVNNSNISLNDLYNLLNETSKDTYVDLNALNITQSSIDINNKIYINSLLKKQYY